jgi:hypothetical protein
MNQALSARFLGLHGFSLNVFWFLFGQRLRPRSIPLASYEQTAIIRWSEVNDISGLVGQPIKLRFQL